MLSSNFLATKNRNETFGSWIILRVIFLYFESEGFPVCVFVKTPNVVYGIYPKNLLLVRSDLCKIEKIPSNIKIKI